MDMTPVILDRYFGQAALGSSIEYQGEGLGFRLKSTRMRFFSVFLRSSQALMSQLVEAYLQMANSIGKGNQLYTSILDVSQLHAVGLVNLLSVAYKFCSKIHPPGLSLC